MKAFQKWPFFHPRDVKSELYRWLSTRRYLFTLEKPPTTTHTMFNGGSLMIPDEQSDNFIKLLAKDIAGGRQWCIAEMITPDAFAMYMDFDFQTLEAYHHTDEILKIYHEMLLQYYPEIGHEESELVTNVCIRPATEENPGKVGVHFITPALIVDYKRANLFARHLQFLLNQRLPGHAWNDIVDLGVFNNGLRMCYNLKTKQCEQCGPERKRIQPLRKRHKQAERNIDAKLDEWKLKFPPTHVFSIADCIAIFPGVTSVEQLQQYGARIHLASQIYPNAQFWNAIRAILRIQLPRPPEYPACDVCNGIGRFYIQRYYDLDSYFSTSLSASTGTATVGTPGVRTLRARSSTVTPQDVEEILNVTRIRRPEGTPLTEPYRVPAMLPVPLEERRPATASSGRTTDTTDAQGIFNISNDHRIVSVVNASNDQRVIGVTEALHMLRPEYDGIQVNSLLIGTLKTTEQTQLRKIGREERRVNTEVSNIAAYSRLPNGLMTFYKDNDVLQVDRVWVSVSGEGAKFCHNKGAAHRQNHIYFEISNSGECYQRCHSTKAPVRGGHTRGACNKYRHKLGTISVTLQKLLFPTIRTDTYHPLFTQRHMIDDPVLFQQRMQSDILSVTWRYYEYALERFVQTGSMDFKTEKDKDKDGGDARDGDRRGGRGRGRGRNSNDNDNDFAEDIDDLTKDPEEQFIRQNRKRNITAVVANSKKSKGNGSGDGEVRSIMDLMPGLADGKGMTTTKRKTRRRNREY